MQNFAAHIGQRVGIFIDTQNLYHSAKSLFRSRVNYEELILQAVNKRSLMRAFAYVITSEEQTEDKFIDALEEMGIEIKAKDLQIFHTGAKKADWDVGIAVDMIRMADKLDVIVLASGDGDFLEVVRYCQSKGVRVEVMAFEKTSNDALLNEVDYFVDLSGEEKRFLISKNSRKITRRIPEKSKSSTASINKNSFTRGDINKKVDPNMFGYKSKKFYDYGSNKAGSTIPAKPVDPDAWKKQ